MTAAGKSVSKSEKHDAHAEGVSRENMPDLMETRCDGTKC
jgi:hypothetical protein